MEGFSYQKNPDADDYQMCMQGFTHHVLMRDKSLDLIASFCNTSYKMLVSTFDIPMRYDTRSVKGDDGRMKIVHVPINGHQPIPICAEVEAELAELDAEEAAEYLESLGLEKSGLETLAQAAYRLLGLQSYFTAGPKEVRAWTVRIGAKAPEAAGVIHSDFERGFIKAKTISYEDYIALGGETGAREAGKLRMEGKDYVVQDGDVMEFMFNV